MRFSALMSLLALVLWIAPPGAIAQEKQDAETKLLEAELLEVGKGDLAKAMAIYQALVEAEATPEPIRARALLYLARCHRKKGQLGKAQTLLAELVRKHRSEAAVVRQAESFLKELQTGKPTSPAFDWMGAMEKNPEIQARVFQLAMDLAEPEGNEGVLARKQLLALGRAAVPMLEKLCDTSREPLHRQMLALILAHAGGYERLGVLFGEGEAPYEQELDEHLMEFALRAEAYPPGERKRLLQAIAAIRPQPRFAGYLAMLQFMAGDHADLGAKLAAMEALPGEPLLAWNEEQIRLHKRLPKLLTRDATLAGVLARRLKDPGCPDEAADIYMETLQGTALEQLGPERVAKTLIRLQEHYNITSYAKSILRKLEAEKRFDTITELVSIKQVGEAARDYLDEQYLKTGHASVVPSGWANALLAGGLHAHLHRIAEKNDAFVDAFVELLRRRKKVAPSFRGYRLKETEAHYPLLAKYTDWAPSASFAAGMSKVLSIKDPISLTIAIEALAFAREGVGPSVGKQLLEVYRDAIARSSKWPDRNVAYTALFALLRRAPHWPKERAFAVRGLFAEIRDWISHVDQFNPDSAGGLDYVSPRGGRFGIPDAAPGSPAALLVPGLVHAASERDAEAVRWLARRLPEARVKELVTGAVPELTNPWSRNALLRLERERLLGLSQTAEGKRFLEACVKDRRLEPWARARAVDLAWPESIQWIDWERVFRDEAKFCGWITRYSSSSSSPDLDDLHTRFREWFDKLPLPRKERLLLAMIQSDDPVAGRWAVTTLSAAMGKRRVEFILSALHESEQRIETQAWYVLMEADTVDVAPYLIRVLEDPKFAPIRRHAMQFKETINKLVQIAPPEAIPPLVKLLDGPEIRVRAEALRGLWEIKRALEEKAEWKRIVEELKKQTDPGKKKE